MRPNYFRISLQLLIILRKESNMTPKQWYDFGDAVIQVRLRLGKYPVVPAIFLYNRREVVLASGRKDSVPWERTGK